MKQLYKIEEFGTMGWELISEEATKLTREQCDDMLQMYLNQGECSWRVEGRLLG